MIHETAIVDPDAQLAQDVEVGPYTIIGADVSIDSGTKIGPHVVIKGPTKIGKNNHFYQFSSIGEASQDKKFRGSAAYLNVGDNNIIREFVTLNRGGGGSETRIGNHNLLMAYVHVAHDCQVGNNTVFANNASLAGHVTVQDYAIISGFSAVRQFTNIGKYSFVAAKTMVIKDVLPYVLVSDTPAEPYGLNVVGLRRHGFSEETIVSLKRAYKIIYRQKLTVPDAISKLQEMVATSPEVQLLIDGLVAAERGVTR